MPDQRETEVPLLFPFQGIDNSQGYDYQRPGTTQNGVNVRTYEAGQDRRRGGSRAGLTPFFGKGSTVQVNGFSLIQSLSCIVTASGTVTPVVPVITSFGFAYLSGNQPTTITGSGFTGATSVLFGAIPAQWFYVVSDTQINCSMFPVSVAQTVTLSVVTPNGTATAPFGFLYAPIDGTFTLAGESGSAVSLVTGALSFAGKIYTTSQPDPLAVCDTSLNLTYVDLSGSASTVCQCCGPDGNIWSVDQVNFAGSVAKYVWKTIPGGASTRYTLETSSTNKFWTIMPGPKDGNLFVFASDNASTEGFIYKVALDGTVTKYGPFLGQQLLGACMGPDLKAWGTPGVFVGGFLPFIEVDLTVAPPVLTTHNTSPARAMFNVVVGNDLRVWSSDNAGRYYAFNVASPSGGSYYDTGLSVDVYAQACAGPDGKVWQIAGEDDVSNASLISRALDGTETEIPGLDLTSNDVYSYLILVAGKDGFLYCAGQGTTSGSFAQFTGAGAIVYLTDEDGNLLTDEAGNLIEVD